VVLRWELIIKSPLRNVRFVLKRGIGISGLLKGNPDRDIIYNGI